MGTTDLSSRAIEWPRRRCDEAIQYISHSDIRIFFDDIAEEAEVEFNKHNGGSTRFAYRDINHLMGRRKVKKEIPIKSKNGEFLTKDCNIKGRWKEHFEEILNKPIPFDAATDEILLAERNLNVDTSEIRLSEVERAIKDLKQNKAHGCDLITTEMFKIDEVKMPRVLVKFFNDLWNMGELQNEWKKE